jgi:hypothetical protein
MKKIVLPVFIFISLKTSSQNVGIGTIAPLARLHVTDSNVVFTGPVSVPSTTNYKPPVQGAGTRMMWYPQKGAFRVGSVNSVQWNKDSIGRNSFASGYNTKALTYASVAMGDSTTASGYTATAFGAWTVASNTASTAMGEVTLASGYASTAMGNTTVASGDNSTAMGSLTTASGYAATAMGDSTIASGNYSTTAGRASTASNDYASAIGLRSVASGFASVALGESDTASGLNAVAMGFQNNSVGNFTTAIGGNNTAGFVGSVAMGVANKAISTYATTIGGHNSASGYGSTAIGHANTASGWNSTALGNYTIALGDWSTAMGFSTIAAATSSFAAGNSTKARSPNSFVAGKFNDTTLTNSLFEIGMGTSNSFRKNAMTVFNNGQVGIGTINPYGLLNVGNGSVRFDGMLTAGTNSILLSMGPYGDVVVDKPNLQGGRFLIKENGYVGIGATNPAGILHVGNGLVRIEGPVSPNSGASLSLGGNGEVVIDKPNTPGGRFILKENGNIGIGNANPSARLHLTLTATGNTLLPTASMIIDNNFSHFINLTTSDYHSTGIFFGNSLGPGDGGVVYNSINTSSNPRSLNFYAANAIRMKVYNNGDAWIQGSLTQNSDEQLKKNISPLSGTLSSLQQLTAYTYYWKDETLGKKQQIGLLAQELQKVYPQLVKENGEGILSVNYIGLIPVLIESIKEMKIEIENLKTQKQ